MSKWIEHTIVGILSGALAFVLVFAYLRYTAVVNELEMTKGQVEIMAFMCNMQPPIPIQPPVPGIGNNAKPGPTI